jgi:hypothetical protein
LAGDVILTPCAAKGVAAVVFPAPVVFDWDDAVKGACIAPGDGANICAYTVADHTTENMIIIPIVRNRDILKPNLNKVKILCTTHYKNVADVGLQI